MGDSCKNGQKATGKTCPQQRARSLAYEEPSKEVQNGMAASKQRVCARLAAIQIREGPAKHAHETVRERGDTVTCQLKAAKALNRLRLSKLRQQQVKVLTLQY